MFVNKNKGFLWYNHPINQEVLFIMAQDTASGSRRMTVIVVVITSFTTAFTGSSLNLSIPSIAFDYGVSATLVGWMVTAYALSVAAFAVPFGRIADITSRKKILVIGIAGFSACCGLSALAPSFMFLLILRFAQGVFASMIFSTNSAIIISAFPPQMRGKAIGYNLAGVYVGLSSGPVIGGIINAHLGWRSIFVFTCGLVLIAGILAALRIPADKASRAGRPLDVPGNLLFILFIVALMYGLSRITEGGLLAPVLIAVGLASGVAFVIHEYRQQDPAVDVRLFVRNRGFGLSNLSALLNYSVTAGLSYLMSIYLQVVQGYPSQTAGLIMVSQPVIMALLSPRFGRLSDRVSPFKLSSIGMAVTGAGMVMLLFIGQSTHVVYVIASLFMTGLGFSMFSSPNTNAIMSCVDRSDYGVASSLVSTMRTIGQTMGMVVVTMISAFHLGAMPLAEAPTDLLLKVLHASFGASVIFCATGVIISLQRKRDG